MHTAAYHFVLRAVSSYGACGPVFEIGSRNINGSVRPLFNGLPYVGIDLTPGPDVDAVADGRDYVPDAWPNTIVCCEVLEHTPYAIVILHHACDVLLPGGLIILTTADRQRKPHSAIDGGPLRPGEHYANLTLDGVLAALKHGQVAVLTAESNGQDLCVVGRKQGIA